MKTANEQAFSEMCLRLLFFSCSEEKQKKEVQKENAAF